MAPVTDLEFERLRCVEGDEASIGRGLSGQDPHGAVREACEQRPMAH